MEERAVRAVDVVPQSLARTKVGHRVERINSAGIGRAGVRHHGKWREALPTIFPYRAGENVHFKAIALVGSNRANAIGHDAGHLGRLQHRMVRLV